MDLSTIENALIVLALFNLGILIVLALLFYQNTKLEIQIRCLWDAINELENSHQEEA